MAKKKVTPKPQATDKRLISSTIITDRYQKPTIEHVGGHPRDRK